MKTTLSMILASLVLASAVASVAKAPEAPKAETPARLAYAFEAPMSVASSDDAIVLSEVLITAPRMPRKASNVKASGGCAIQPFGFRSVLQGPADGQVRGFCL